MAEVIQPQTQETPQVQTKGGNGGTLLGAIAGGLMDMANQGINYAITKKFNEDTFTRNKQLSELAFEQNKKLMAMENNWQSEASQAARLRAAGIDPNKGNVSSHASASAAPLDYQPYNPTIPQFDIGGAINDSFQNYRDFEKLRLNKELTAAQAAELMSKVDLNGATEWLHKMQGRLSEIEASQKIGLFPSLLSAAQSDAKLKEIASMYADQKSAAELANLIKDGVLKDTLNSLNQEQIKYYTSMVEKIGVEKEKLTESINWLKANTKLTDKQAELATWYFWVHAVSAGVGSVSDIINAIFNAKRTMQGKQVPANSSDLPPAKSLPLPDPEKPKSPTTKGYSKNITNPYERTWMEEEVGIDPNTFIDPMSLFEF